MEAYPADIERMMRRLFGSLGERDRRRYAAIEAANLGQGSRGKNGVIADGN